jgi:hypothetical protein
MPLSLQEAMGSYGQADASSMSASPTNAKCSANGSCRIKSSSLSYANAAGRVGFDFNTYYNDFTNEGHIYPVHGVGDLDKTVDLLAKFIKSGQGDAFGITDLGIQIKVADDSLINNNCFIDFHTIPTKILDGSTKLPNGMRVENLIPYFNGGVESGNLTMSIDWISGNAKFVDPVAAASVPGFAPYAYAEHPTTLASTRASPFLGNDEHLALTFFMDGKQARLNNGGSVSNWRYVVPLGVGKQIKWFVAKAWTECGAGDDGCKSIKTTSGDSVSVRARKASETDDLESIAYEKNRYMETVSESVAIKASPFAAGFNQRYGDKCADFGDLVLKDEPTNATCPAGQQATCDAVTVASSHEDKQVRFFDMLQAIKKHTLDFPRLHEAAPLSTEVEDILNWFRDSYLALETYNISPKALVTKAHKPPSYMWTPVCETGWMVVEGDGELAVPDDDGEYFIGWVIETQPMHGEDSGVIDSATSNKELLNDLSTRGYAMHQGPGIIYQTCGDFAHVGTQEPFILKHNHVSAQQLNEPSASYASRVKSQLPNVHWRLDAHDVIKKSLEKGAITEANVGAGQAMLASIGTKTPLAKPSRSPNFLGRYYQELLASPETIRELVDREASGNEVYVVESVDEKLFVYGTEQQTGNAPTYP